MVLNTIAFSVSSLVESFATAVITGASLIAVTVNVNFVESISDPSEANVVMIDVPFQLELGTIDNESLEGVTVTF